MDTTRADEPWHVAIERPEASMLRRTAWCNRTAWQSRPQRRVSAYYLRDGKRYSHTIDPRTGRPIEHGLAAVVVIGPSCMQTDAWATAFNVLGPERAGRSRTACMAVMFIEWQDGKLVSHATPEFGEHLLTEE